MSRKLMEKIDRLLARERGAVRKPPGGTEISIALAYPNTYHVGMSNLGIHQMYSLLNRKPGTVCERVFLPDEEDIGDYDREGLKLFCLESRRPVKEFDILAFSVSFEQDYINILEMLRLAGIPARKQNRPAAAPLLLLGGICSFFNPEPLAEFFDVVVVGEGEEAAGEVVDVFRAHCGEGRSGLLRALCRISGVYVPEFYEVRYGPDGTIREREKQEPSAPDRIAKRTIADLDRAPAASAIMTPDTEFGDMFLSEITRGCGRHCRFCMAGYLYLPPRALSLERAKAQAAGAEDFCGKIGLVGAAISDYRDIGELCEAIRGPLSVSSLRADSVSADLIDRLARSGHKTVAIAPEAGSDRLRRVINKGITETDLLRAADLIFGRGIPNLKLYFIIGLPTETQEDIDSIITLAKQVHEVQLKHARPLGRIGRITLSVNSFIPKPFTPFQWEPMASVGDLNRKLRFLERAVRRIGNVNIIHDLPKWERIQATLSRGDRRIGELIEAAHAHGEDWSRAVKETGIDTGFFVDRRRSVDEILPWDFIDIGVRKEYLRKEYERGLAGVLSPPCNVGSCRTCGVCS